MRHKHSRDNVLIEEFEALSEIEQRLLHKIHLKTSDINEPVSFQYIITSFKGKYSFDEVAKGLNALKGKGYLREKSFYESTFSFLEYPGEMDETDN